MKILSRPLYVMALVGVSVLMLGACRLGDNPIARISPESFTATDEKAIGNTLSREQWRDGGQVFITPDSDQFTDGAYDYLRPLLRGLLTQAAVTRRDSFDWDVRVVLDDELHAYTLPGGRIILYSGLLQQLSSEAECISVLAREVAIAETGAAMAALDRQVDDNVLLGDLILNNPVGLTDVIEALPNLSYTRQEMARVDSLVAVLVCPSDYDELVLTKVVSSVGNDSKYARARPVAAYESWSADFSSLVVDCPGADSLYAARYREMISSYLP